MPNASRCSRKQSVLARFGLRLLFVLPLASVDERARFVLAGIGA
jgi:hypothetical protein